MIEGLKPFFNSLLRPLVRPAVALGIRPNHITIAGLALSGIAAWLVCTGRWSTACIVAAAGSLLDGLDGVLARESHQKSTFGAILDSSCDRLTEIILLSGVLGRFLTFHQAPLDREILSLPLYMWGGIFCYSAITMSLMVSYIKARCEGEGVQCSRGLLQRPERIILFCAGLLAGPAVMVWVLSAISLLAAVTAGQRLFEAYRKTTTG